MDVSRFRSITESTLEGLAKRELNLSALIGKAAEARERRLVPEVIEDFFLQASPVAALRATAVKADGHVYRLGRVPRHLWPFGEEQEPRFGRLGRDYRQIVFDQKLLRDDPTSEWITPGHPLFETVRSYVLDQVQDDLRRGAVFYDLHTREPYRLDAFSASIKDGRGRQIHRRLFVVQSTLDGQLLVRQPTVFLDLVAAPDGTDPSSEDGFPDRSGVEHALVEQALREFLDEIVRERTREVDTITRHVEISLNELINRQNLKLAELVGQQERGEIGPTLAANIKQAEDRVEELVGRLERRLDDLKKERQCMIGDILHVGRAWALPHPERETPQIAPMVRDDATERLAVDAVIAYEEARGWKVESVEQDDRGFDLISRKPHPEDPKTAIEIRFIEVKGRAAVGEVWLSTNEYKTAQRLKNDYWLYAVFNCAAQPAIHTVQDPGRLGWEPVTKVEHYRVGADTLLESEA
jgi:hypothetical protein